jgi:drug/metabolite transporter (DMT)-like permease
VLDYFKLHFVIVLWGLTAVLGNLVDLSATQLVFYRSGLAAIVLAAVLRLRLKVSPRDAVMLFGNGMILGGHWILFFLAVKISSVSVCMIGMATVSFWTALLEPMLNARVAFKPINLMLGLIAACGVGLIYGSQPQFHAGIVVAVVSAWLACLFSIFNGRLFHRAPANVVVTYQMAGSALLCAIGLVISKARGWNLASEPWVPPEAQWIWITILVLVCTIYAYRVYVALLQRLSVFTINFANNLEPVYGIALGALLFQDHQDLTVSFYVGAAVIILSVMAQPWLSRQPIGRINPKPQF